MAAAKTRKVGNPSTDTSSKGKSDAKTPDPDKGRKTYNYKKAQLQVPVVDEDGNATDELQLVSAVNSEGKLIGVPTKIVDEDGETVQSGYDPFKHKPLIKTDFASEDVFIDYRAFVAQCKSDAFGKRAKLLVSRANKMRKFGDDKTRKAMKKRDRMRKEMAALEAELTAEGVDLDAFDEEDEETEE